MEDENEVLSASDPNDSSDEYTADHEEEEEEEEERREERGEFFLYYKIHLDCYSGSLYIRLHYSILLFKEPHRKFAVGLFLQFFGLIPYTAGNALRKPPLNVAISSLSIVIVCFSLLSVHATVYALLIMSSKSAPLDESPIMVVEELPTMPRQKSSKFLAHFLDLGFGSDIGFFFRFAIKGCCLWDCVGTRSVTWR